MPLDIIGAGFGRTGTSSLRTALDMLGAGPCHHMSEVYQNPEQVSLWCDVLEGRADYHRIFRDYRAAVDFPVAAVWQELLAVWPDARIILSERDPEAWFDSISNTILPLIQNREDGPEESRAWLGMCDRLILQRVFGGRTDRAGMIAAYEANSAAARALSDTGRVLVHRSSDGWAPLCRFLGKPVPEVPYPRKNAREQSGDAAKSDRRPAEADLTLSE